MPSSDMPVKPVSDFFSGSIVDSGELSWMEIRALASIGAGLLKRHVGDAKAIEKLGRLAVPFDSVRHNETAKALALLLEEAAGRSFEPTDQDWADLAELAGYKPEIWEKLLADRDASEK